jgi:hypothetical protein
MHYVIEASYLDGYKLRIRFETNEIRIVDLAEHLARIMHGSGRVSRRARNRNPKRKRG